MTGTKPQLLHLRGGELEQVNWAVLRPPTRRFAKSGLDGGAMRADLAIENALVKHRIVAPQPPQNAGPGIALRTQRAPLRHSRHNIRLTRPELVLSVRDVVALCAQGLASFPIHRSVASGQRRLLAPGM